MLVIKAQQYRTLEKNREDALRRLYELIESVAQAPRRRRPTRPTLGAKKKRLDTKIRRGKIKQLRLKVRSSSE